MDTYGKEVILDLHGCSQAPFSRKFLTEYFMSLCDHIDMEREDLHFWDYEDDPDGYAAAEPHLKGISAVQFIKTSNITIHSLDELKQVYLNIFSCKDFDPVFVREFSEHYFGGTAVTYQVVDRK